MTSLRDTHRERINPGIIRGSDLFFFPLLNQMYPITSLRVKFLRIKINILLTAVPVLSFFFDFLYKQHHRDEKFDGGFSSHVACSIYLINRPVPSLLPPPNLIHPAPHPVPTRPPPPPLSTSLFVSLCFVLLSVRLSSLTLSLLLVLFSYFGFGLAVIVRPFSLSLFVCLSVCLSLVSHIVTVIGTILLFWIWFGSDRSPVSLCLCLSFCLSVCLSVCPSLVSHIVTVIGTI